MSKELALLLVYMAVLLGTEIFRMREFRRSPEKKLRYSALPWYYKLACPLIVIPSFVFWPLLLDAASGAVKVALQIAWLVIPISLFLAVEIVCVGWYKKNGHL